MATRSNEHDANHWLSRPVRTPHQRQARRGLSVWVILAAAVLVPVTGRAVWWLYEVMR
mgnify:CR=1 FL=1